MEIDGHPTQDLIDELQRRGAIRVEGDAAGPERQALAFISENLGESRGYWMFVPVRSYMTGMDEIPG